MKTARPSLSRPTPSPPAAICTIRTGSLTADRHGGRLPAIRCAGSFSGVYIGYGADDFLVPPTAGQMSEKLAGFHFNDSKYGDDDLDSGSIDPFRLFLVFNELVDAELREAPGFNPAYMIDQSHNVTDPIESLMQSATEILRAYVQASLVDRSALASAQEESDVLGGHLLIKQAFITDVSPIIAQARTSLASSPSSRISPFCAPSRSRPAIRAAAVS